MLQSNSRIDDLISVITPVYNCADFICATIDSVKSQTYVKWELILVDDCSTDDSVALCLKYSQLDSRIKLYRNLVNMGAAQSRNIALGNSKGKFVCFLDSDDLWRPKKLELQLAFMRNTGSSISFTSYQLMSERGQRLNRKIKAVKKLGYTDYLKNTNIGMSTSMLDCTKTGPVSFKNIRTRQDTHLWLSLLKRGHVAFGMEENLVYYRLRSSSISANKIKAARQVWILYYSMENLGLFKAVWYFLWYAFNASIKRLGI